MLQNMKKILLLIFILLFAISIASPILVAQSETCPTDQPACKKIIEFPSQWKNKLTISAVMGGAAIDAINPCEFAVLILLMGTLLLNGDKKKALISGLAFCAAIFIAYFSMGLGLLSIIQKLHISAWAIKIISIASVIMGILHLKDYIKYEADGFVMEVPKSWRPAMKNLVRGVTNPLGAFATGLVVSLFLLPCTAGPYVVILTLLSNQSPILPLFKTLLYLLLYNSIFIIPMLVIVGVMYTGLKATEAESWRKNKIRLLHLITGVIMILLGAAIWLGWI